MKTLALLLLAVIVCTVAKAQAPTQQEAIGEWQLRCTADVIMDRKACHLLISRKYRIAFMIFPLGGIHVGGPSGMPTRVAMRVDAQKGRETLTCDSDSCQFSRYDSAAFIKQMLAGKELLVAIDAEGSNQSETIDLQDFPAALAKFRQEQGGLIDFLEPGRSPNPAAKSKKPKA